MPQVIKTSTYSFTRKEVQDLLLEAIEKQSRDKGVAILNVKYSFNVANYGEDFSGAEITVQESEH